MSLPDTQAARRAIFTALRSAERGQAAPPPDLGPYLSGPYGNGGSGTRVDPADLIAPFEVAARAWHADVLQVRPAEWPQAVRQALRLRSCRGVAIGASSPLGAGLSDALHGLNLRRFDAKIEGWKVELFDHIDASVTSAAAGIADTGSLVLVPSAGEPRTLSLVPAVHVAVLMASRLHPSLFVAMRALQPQAAMPTNLLLVSGPSKTADIQQTLAYGAHGPRELVIVLVDDLEHQQRVIR